MKKNFIKYFLIILLFFCCIYIIELNFINDRQTITSYKKNMTEMNGQIKVKQDEIEKDKQTLDLLIQQKAKKTELYENLEKWNNEILTYINQ